MLIIDPSFEILSHTPDMERVIERVARVCYKSEDKIGPSSHVGMLKMLKKKGHEAMLEHASITVIFTTNRGVSHEIVRHRIASFAQESTRYVNYGDKGCVFIRPAWFSTALLGEWQERKSQTDSFLIHPVLGRPHDMIFQFCPEEKDWLEDMAYAEMAYNRQMAHFRRLYEKEMPERAREVLPNSTKTEIVVTTNVREWRHVFKLRALGTTGKPHPEMVRIMQPCLDEFKATWPLLFGDLELEMEKE